MIKGFPVEVHASWIARHYWCAEQARIFALEPVGVLEMKPRESLPEVPAWSFWGTFLHDILERRKHWRGNRQAPTESFKNLIRAHAPLSFTLWNTRIFFTPDDFRFTYPHVRIIEYKSTLRYPSRFALAKDMFQLRIYCLGLHRFFQEYYRDLKLDKVHRLQYYKAPRKVNDRVRVLKTFHVYIDDARLREIDHEIKHVFLVWRGKVPPKPPVVFKCHSCAPYFKVRCRFFNKTLSCLEWEGRFG